MAYNVTIQNTKTSETKTYTEPEAWDDVGDYIWTDGNYACDCNRSLFFERAGGTVNHEVSCNDEFFKVKIVDADGTVHIDEGLS